MASYLETTPIDQIKVADLIDMADVSKQTFYRLYEDKFELLKDFYRETIGPFYSDVSSPEAMKDAVKKTLTHLQEHRDMARNMFFSKDAYALKAYVRDLYYEADLSYWKNLGVDIDDERLSGAMRLYAYGTTSFLLEWVKAGAVGDVDVIADQFLLAWPVGLSAREE